MKSVYRRHAGEASAILARKSTARATRHCHLQDKFPGDDSFMHVLTAYCDKTTA